VSTAPSVHQHELAWFFNVIPGAKSNFGAFVAMMQAGVSGGISDPEASISDELLDDMDRHRQIGRRLSHLPTRQVRDA
jgi:hypothetical protein